VTRRALQLNATTMRYVSTTLVSDVLTAVQPGELLAQINPGEITRDFGGYTDQAASQKKVLSNVLKKGDTYFRTGDLVKLSKVRTRTIDEYDWPLFTPLAHSAVSSTSTTVLVTRSDGREKMSRRVRWSKCSIRSLVCARPRCTVCKYRTARVVLAWRTW
jgi:hypothetical protein